MQLDVAGERVQLLDDRAVLWAPAGGPRTVLVADVHLGKGDTFRHFGLPLPDADLDADLARLTGLVRAAAADRLLVLGDLVHGEVGLNEQVVASVAGFLDGLGAELALVPGNHDAPGRRRGGGFRPPPEWAITVLPDTHVEGRFAFAHHPEPVAGTYTWCGHLHPAVIAGRGRLAERFPCFWIGETLGVLPAYGSYTGGRAVRPAPGDRLIAVTPEGLVAVHP